MSADETGADEGTGMEQGRGTEGGEAVGGLPSWAREEERARGRQKEPEGGTQHPRLTPTARQAKYILSAVQPPHRPSPELLHAPKQKLSPLNTYSPAPGVCHPTFCLYEFDDSRDLMWVASHSVPFLLLQRCIPCPVPPLPSGPQPRHIQGRAPSPSSSWAPALRKEATFSFLL